MSVNLNTFIISYDLYQPGQNYLPLIQLIQKNPSWAKIGLSVYIIGTTESYVQVRDKLISVLDKNDKLFVGTVSAPAAWFNLGTAVDNWIKSNLK
jgi:hypothetical protein